MSSLMSKPSEKNSQEKVGRQTATQTVPFSCPSEDPYQALDERSAHFYQLGKQQGQKMLKILTGDSLTPDQDIIKMNQTDILDELVQVFNVLSTTDPVAEEYKTSFAYAQHYMQGYKSILLTYKPVESDDIDVQRRNFFALQQLLFTESFITASDHLEWKKNIDFIMHSMQEDTTYFSTSSLQERHSAFNTGHEVGLHAAEYITKKAQNPEVPGLASSSIKEDCKKQIDEFFKGLTFVESQEKQNALRNYFLGFEKALKELSLEDLLKNIPQEKALLIRKQYDQALKRVQEGRRLATQCSISSQADIETC